MAKVKKLTIKKMKQPKQVKLKFAKPKPMYKKGWMKKKI